LAPFEAGTVFNFINQSIWWQHQYTFLGHLASIFVKYRYHPKGSQLLLKIIPPFYLVET